jgi:adenosylmethionine-8-amino-7-oxononanoate aminotransferase
MKSNAWHPYNSLPAHPTPLSVVSAQGHYLQLTSGEKLLDGIASWWTAIFGYNHPALVDAINQQSQQLSHVMFGGLTHPAAEQLADALVQLSPTTPSVFFSDSGSVAVEVALKMARQYWQALGKTDKTRFVALKQGYHGDTWGAMGVSDPHSLHQQFRDASAQTFFVNAPLSGFIKDDNDTNNDIASIQRLFEQEHHQIAAIIVEPIWQGAGAMNFYRPDYLQQLRKLCDHYQVLLICDEIATGFGKTGKLFAHQHADITPDILCLGKALTGGMLTLAATCTSHIISDTISDNAPYRFMHGPTYMANALACACASASIQLLHDIDWQPKVMRWQSEISNAFKSLSGVEGIKETRVLGHVGVIEMTSPALAAAVQPLALANGLWLRPFGNWVYITPAYTMNDSEREQLLTTTVKIAQQACQQKLNAHPEAI